jgi:antibiotic biosynthesis monooxygenase (ABM) superfamily enzyme
LLGVALAALAGFVAVLVPRMVNSDSAAVVLLAHELAKSGGWLSPDWYYVSDSLMFDGSVHVAKVGVLLFGAGVGAARFTIAIGIVLVLLAGLWLGRTLSVRPVPALLAMCAFLLGPSLIHQDLILGLPSTYQIAMVLALLACAIRFGLHKGAPWYLALATALILLMSASAPKKALVYMLVPVIGGVASQWLGGRDRGGSANSVRTWSLLAASVAAWGAGDWLHALLKRGLVVNTTYARMSFVPDPAHVLDNLGTIGALAWRFAGGGNGVVAAIAAVLAIACAAWLVLAPVATRRPWRALRGERGFAYGFAMAGTLAIFAYLLLYEQIRQYYGIYYGLVTLAPLFLLAAARASDAANDAGARTQVLSARGALSCLLVLGVVTTAMASARFPADYFGFSKKQSSTSVERMQAVAWLEANGYLRGFGDYWDANSMTLLSGGRVQVAWLHISRAKNRTNRLAWLSSEERANFVPGREKWFIAINARRPAVKPLPACMPADRMVEVASYRIYLYHQPMPGCLAPPINPRRGS